MREEAMSNNNGHDDISPLSDEELQRMLNEQGSRVAAAAEVDRAVGPRGATAITCARMDALLRLLTLKGILSRPQELNVL